MEFTVLLCGNRVKISVEGPYKAEDDWLMVIASIPGNNSFISRQMYCGGDSQIPVEILQSAAGCLYPHYAPGDSWDHGSMG